MEHTYRLVISCPDRVGIVAKVSNFLSTYNGWITEASHHSDTQTGWFFMRHEIKATSIPFGLDQFRAAFEPIAREFNMNWHIADSAQPKKVILMCSKVSHCVADLLHRWHSKEINAEIVAVISNHDARFAERHTLYLRGKSADCDTYEDSGTAGNTHAFAWFCQTRTANGVCFIKRLWRVWHRFANGISSRSGQ